MSDYNWKPKRQDKNTEKFVVKDKLLKKNKKKSLRDLRGGRPKKDEDDKSNS